jgi:cytochrome P450
VRARQFYESMQLIDPNRFFKRFVLAPIVKHFPPIERRVFKGFRDSMSALDALIIEELALRRAVPAAERRDDILSMLLEARDEDGNPMTDRELRDELVTLVVAGHETTATALAWTFELVLRHPEVWQRIVNEAHEGGFEYVDAVIKESLRMRPILPIIGRRVKEPVEVAGHTLPLGSGVSPNIFLAHYREASYPDAEQFRPERFIGEQPSNAVWLPFGGGIRRCIGASFALYEMRVVLQEIARRVDLRLERDVPERIVRRAITFAPGKDVQIVVDAVRPRGRDVASATPAEPAAA